MGRSKGHEPIRTCISCKAKRTKTELIRLALDAQGRVVRDESGNRPGRGAYVCKSPSCWEGLVRGNILTRAFRQAVIHPSLEVGMK